MHHFSWRNHQGNLLDSGLNFFWKLVTVGEKENSGISGFQESIQTIPFLLIDQLFSSISFSLSFLIITINLYDLWTKCSVYKTPWSWKIGEDSLRNAFSNTVLLEDMKKKKIWSAAHWQNSFAANNRIKFQWHSKDTKQMSSALGLHMNGATVISVHFLMAG